MNRDVLGREGTILYLYCPGCRHSHLVDPARWAWSGGMERPTFSPSVLVHGDQHGGLRCHFWVRDGRIEFCSDSQHELAGQTVDLEPGHGLTFPGIGEA